MIKYDRLWETMDEKGITKYTLTQKYQISKSLLHRLQNNEGVSMHTINTLCRILNCKIEDIATYYDEDDESSKMY
ncbi:MAG: helix-turn-helix transcriptional regulator [Clostridiales bacterium]|nr:helix-turn-helix transcriptional regulator [Clostridiales bacterium]